MTRFLLLLTLALLPLGSGLCAVVDVYTGKAEVTGQGSTERQRALPLALEHALQKYSGLRDLEGYPDLELALQTAPDILVTFYYDSEERKGRKYIPMGPAGASFHHEGPGNVDHILWVTMTDEAVPEMAKITLEGIYDRAGRDLQVKEIYGPSIFLYCCYAGNIADCLQGIGVNVYPYSSYTLVLKSLDISTICLNCPGNGLRVCFKVKGDHHLNLI